LLVEFVLRKDPREQSVPRLYRESLKVSGDMSIEILKKFLGKKLTYSHSYLDFQITVSVGGKQVIMHDSITLKEIRNEICDCQEGTCLMLHYFVQPNACNTIGK
jgi:hypothetical protein